MPNYCFVCPPCDEHKDVYRPINDHAKPEICSCGRKMKRDFVREHASVRGDYKKPIISTSLAFDSGDVDEHRRLHPGVELQIDTASHTAYPILRNLNQKRKYLKARGWKDVNSYG